MITAEYQVGEPCDTCVLISFGLTSPSVLFSNLEHLEFGSLNVVIARGTTVLKMSCNEKEETNNIYRERLIYPRIEKFKSN